MHHTIAVDTNLIYLLAALPAGLLFGFIISIPMTGPLGVYLTGKGIAGQVKQGVFSAVGCAAIETIYCFVACMGIASLIPYESHKDVILFVGSFLILYLGITGLTKSAVPSESRIKTSFYASLGDFSVGLFVTIFNPWVMLNWIAVAAIIATQGIEFNVTNASLFSLGVGAGTVIWFYIYLIMLKKVGTVLKLKYLHNSLRALSIALIVIGAYLFCTNVGPVLRRIF